MVIIFLSTIYDKVTLAISICLILILVLGEGEGHSTDQEIVWSVFGNLSSLPKNYCKMRHLICTQIHYFPESVVDYRWFLAETKESLNCSFISVFLPDIFHKSWNFLCKKKRFCLMFCPLFWWLYQSLKNFLQSQIVSGNQVPEFPSSRVPPLFPAVHNGPAHCNYLLHIIITLI